MNLIGGHCESVCVRVWGLKFNAKKRRKNDWVTRYSMHALKMKNRIMWNMDKLRKIDQTTSPISL